MEFDPPPEVDLRYEVGATAEVWLADKWRKCEIASLWHRDKSWPKDAYVPYAVRLFRTGRWTYAPTDSHLRANALDADPATLAARFVAAHLPTGRRVEIECGDRIHRGTLEALDPTGSLRVRGDDGVVQAWPAASTRILSWEPGGDDCARVDPPHGPMT